MKKLSLLAALLCKSKGAANPFVSNRQPPPLWGGLGRGLFFSLFLLSCARPQALQYKGIDRVSLGSVGMKGLTLAFDVRLYNPNVFALRLTGADLNAYINSRFAGKAQLLSSQDIPASDTFLLPISVSLDAANLLGNAVDVLTEKDVNVKLEGKVRAGKRKGGPVLPVRVRYEGRQRVTF